MVGLQSTNVRALDEVSIHPTKEISENTVSEIRHAFRSRQAYKHERLDLIGAS